MNNRGQDCLTTLRFIAALQVMCQHTIDHLHLVNLQWVKFILGYFSGIPVFFTLSGFLIWMSIGRSSSFVQYGKKRLIRIYPELIVAVVVEVMAIICLFKGTVNWPKLGLFAFLQATVFPLWTPEFLRSYGCGTPNGVLWSIFALVQFYIIAYPCYRLLHGRGIRRWLFGLALAFLSSVSFVKIRPFLPGVVGNVLAVSFVADFWMFLLGAFASEYKDRIIPILIKFWYVPVVVRLVMMYVPVPEVIPVHYYGVFSTIAIFCASMALAYRFPKFELPLDISYGMYIYHMTFVNILICLGCTGGRMGQLLVVVLATCFMAYVSAKTIVPLTKLLKARL